MPETSERSPMGSTWARWDPHLHTPGTARADRFNDDWDGFLQRIAEASPAPVALGITDYLSLDGYERMVAFQEEGRLGAGTLLFPNIEFRLTERADEGSSVNIHLLIDPSDRDHVSRTQAALRGLKAVRQGETITCCREDLIRLGAKLAPHGGDLPEEACYRLGNEQFKVSFDTFREWREGDSWLRRSSLVAVSLKTGDGSSGLTYRQGSNRSLRQEIEDYSDVFFSGRPNDRSFWLGHTASGDADGLRSRGGPKPCIHGSDAHDLAGVLNPAEQRFTWIKGEPTFDGLRQIVFEPEHRVYIGDSPPNRADPFSTMRELQLSDPTGRFQTQTLSLNQGLIAIIGEKGSGKTALADAIALAAGARRSRESFLDRAGHLLDGFRSTIVWADDHVSERALDNTDPMAGDSNPEVRYLSQQFVDDLCSDRTPESALRREIESVVFQHVPGDQTLGAGNFSDLRDMRTADIQEERRRLSFEIERLSIAIAEQDAQLALLPSKLESKRVLLARSADNEKEVLERRPPPESGGAETTTRLTQLEALGTEIHRLEERITHLEQQSLRAGQLRTSLEAAKSDALREGIEAIALLVAMGVDAARLQSAFETELTAAFAPLLNAAVVARDSSKTTAASEREGQADPSQSLESLRKERKALEKSIDADKRQLQFLVALHRTGLQLKTQIQALESEIAGLNQLPQARKVAIQGRFVAYERFFELLAAERIVLEDLYAPLGATLTATRDAAGTFALSISPLVDVESWLAQGLDLFDNRRSVQAPIVEPGALAALARTVLHQAWANLDGRAARAGLEEVIALITKGGPVQQQVRSGVTPRAVADWLFSTRQISLQYDIHYGGTALWNLSPGTRGIALLLLYLATDVADSRPLVVDQPDENLDNRSIYGLLRPFLLAARNRRQVVVITHNPNLVVGADADQIVVASASPKAEGLPAFVYTSGALESRETTRLPAMRRVICDLMEGGEDAFLAREQRYGPLGQGRRL